MLIFLRILERILHFFFQEIMTSSISLMVIGLFYFILFEFWWCVELVYSKLLNYKLLVSVIFPYYSFKGCRNCNDKLFHYWYWWFVSTPFGSLAGSLLTSFLLHLFVLFYFVFQCHWFLLFLFSSFLRLLIWDFPNVIFLIFLSNI